MEETIVTLTMNPAVDLCTSIERLEPSHKLRCGHARHDAGGGGINVARVVRRLGGDPLALFPAGGPMGELLKKLVRAEGVRFLGIPIKDDTREDITVDETATGAQYRFILQGPTLAPPEIQACLDALRAVLGPSTFLVASGSLPPGVTSSFYGEVREMAAAAGSKFVLDSAGPGLKAALGSGLYLIKPSLREFEALTGETLPDNSARARAAHSIIERGGCELIALTLGEEGALLCAKCVSFLATAPKVAALTTVGAGDSFLGALVWSLAQKKDLSEALPVAVAAGSAALLLPGTELCRVDQIEWLKSHIRVSEL